MEDFKVQIAVKLSLHKICTSILEPVVVLKSCGERLIIGTVSLVNLAVLASACALVRLGDIVTATRRHKNYNLNSSKISHKISVIIPCFEESRNHLVTLLSSLVHGIKQYNAQVVIVDASKKQICTEIVRNVSKSWESHGLIPLKSITSISTSSRNTSIMCAQGAAVANGSIIALVPSNCIVPCTFFSSIIGAFKQNSQLEMGCFSNEGVSLEMDRFKAQVLKVPSFSNCMFLSASLCKSSFESNQYSLYSLGQKADYIHYIDEKVRFPTPTNNNAFRATLETIQACFSILFSKFY